jgi:hypothetical protein
MKETRLIEDSSDELLNDIMDAIQKYCILPTHHDYIAATLWVAHTHLVPAFYFAPRLVIRSPQKGSGKTRLLEIISELVHNPLRSVQASPSSIFRSLGSEDACDHRPTTLIFDEVDTLFGTNVKAAQNEDLRALLNAGYQRGYPVARAEPNGKSWEVVNYETFAPAALAGIGRLPDTIEDRAVVIPMRKRAPGEQVSDFRARRDKPTLNAIRDRLAEWSTGMMPTALELADSSPHSPVTDRAADLWEPLLIIAELAGEDWLALAHDACKFIQARYDEYDVDHSVGQQLLGDIHGIYRDSAGDFISSTELANRLRGILDAGWFDENLTPKKLAIKLGEYAIRPRHSHDKKLRGYYWADFRDAWTRYIRLEVSEPSPTPNDQQEYGDTSGWSEVSAKCPPDTGTDGGHIESDDVYDHNPSSNYVSDTSDTSDTNTDLPLSGNLSAEQKARVVGALARARGNK